MLDVPQHIKKHRAYANRAVVRGHIPPLEDGTPKFSKRETNARNEPRKKERKKVEFYC